MSRRLLRRFSDGSRVPNLWVLAGDSGVANLPVGLTVNGATVQPTLRYYGNDATVAQIPAQIGDTLLTAGSGTDPLVNQVAYGNGSNDGTLKFVAGKYYASASGSFADIGTEDFVFEVCGYWDGIGADSYFLSKIGAAGLQFDILSTGALRCLIYDGVGTASVVSPALIAGEWFHAILFMDRSGSGIWYLNNTAGSAAAISSVGSISDPATPINFGSLSGTNKTSSGFSFISMWQGASMLATHLNPVVAAERFQKYSGIYPQRATGTSAPNSFTRSTSGYVEKYNPATGVTNLINCSAGLPRVGRKLDSSGYAFEGILIEPQATNLLLYSNDIDNAEWIKVRATIDTTATEVTPDSDVYYQGIVASIDSDSHRIVNNVNTTNENYTLSVLAKSGFCNWIRLQNATVSGDAYFDISNGVVGTSTSVVDSGIKDVGNGNHLCWITVTCTAAQNQFAVWAVEGDGDVVFAGDASTVSAYVAFAQIELGNKPSSRIYTAGASATRTADQLKYNGDNVTAGKGAFLCDVCIDDHTPISELSITTITDGGSTDEMIRSYVDTGTVVPIFEAVDSTVSQWSITGSTDIVDGKTHMVRQTWTTNAAKQFIDGAIDGTPDTSCTVPTGIDEIDIGQDSAGANQLNGWIRNIQIWPWDEENLG